MKRSIGLSERVLKVSCSTEDETVDSLPNHKDLASLTTHQRILHHNIHVLHLMGIAKALHPIWVPPWPTYQHYKKKTKKKKGGFLSRFRKAALI